MGKKHAEALLEIGASVVLSDIDIDLLKKTTTPLGINLSKDKLAIEQAEINHKYKSYIKKEQELVDKMNRLDESKINPDFNYTKIPSLSAEGKEKLHFISLNVDHNEALEGGEVISINGETVGVVNSPVWSHRMNMSLALGHIEPIHSAKGTKVRISSNTVDTTAVITELPIYDPQKTRPHA